MTKTITQVFFEARQRPINEIAARFKRKRQWRSLTWKDCYAITESVGAALIGFGLNPQDKVALISNTRLEWWLSDFAIMGAGLVTVPIYQSSREEELAYILNDSQARALIVEDATQLKKWKSIASQCPQVEKVICIFNDSHLPDEIFSWDDLLEEGESQLEKDGEIFSKKIAASKLQDVATLIYTSGTTGEPKGVVLTHKQIMSEVHDVFTAVGLDKRDESLSFLPYSHVMGRIESWGAVYVGFTLSFAESIEKIRANLMEIHPTVMIAVPRIFEKIYCGILSQLETQPLKKKLFDWALGVGKEVSKFKRQKKSLPLPLLSQYVVAKKMVFHPLKEKLGGRLRFAVSGGAPLSKEIAEFFHAADLLLLEGYGLTETTAAIAVNTPYEYCFGSVGKPVGDVELKFEEDGEILVKSDKVMREYYNNSEATEAVFTNGFFRTGDIGHLDDEGYLHITDRKKDLIKTAGGKYVAPQKLENLLKLTPLISQVLIHGDQKKYIVALITLNEEETLRLAQQKQLSFQGFSALTQHETVVAQVRQIVAKVNAQLASHETIKNFAVLDKDFSLADGELTPSLKVKRKFCDEKFRAVIESLY